MPDSNTITIGPGPASSYLQAAQQSAGADPNDPPVYFGMKATGGQHGTNDDAIDPRTWKPQEDIKTLSEANLEFFKWTPEEVAAWGQRLYKSGLVSDPGDFNSLYKAWADAVKMAASFYAAGSQKKMTPWDVIDLQEGLASGQAKTKTTTTKSTSLNIPTSEEADSVTKTMFQNLLGRDPTDGEMSRYRSLLIGKARANPSITTTTTTTDPTGNSTSSSTQSGGFSSAMAQQVVSDSATRDPEYGSYLAGTRYMNYTENALKAPA